MSKDSTEHIDVGYVAQLARLNLSEQEVTAFQGQLDQILSYVHKLDELDTEGVEPTAHAVSLENVFRKDEAHECIDREKFMRNAPAQYNHQILVPRIIE